MNRIKPPTSPDSRTAKRARVLDAAARLLSTSDTADFSMRDLAEEAGVSFATPFNYFGSKMAIMHALSARLIDTMTARFAAAPAAADASARILAAFGIAVRVLLEEPALTKPVIGSLGSPTVEPGHVAGRSRALWAVALGDLAGIRDDMTAIARSSLPDHLALGFRGCISFWVAGEIADEDLHDRACAIAAALLLGFVKPQFQDRLTHLLRLEGAHSIPRADENG
jgi:AcrR family transcriptional regulator